LIGSWVRNEIYIFLGDAGIPVKARLKGLTASCAHFVWLDGSFEAIHGHNFSISFEVASSRKEDLAVDLSRVRAAARAVVDSIDHRLLVPLLNENVKLKREGGCVEIGLPDRRIRLPEPDVFLLEAANTTAEELAVYVCNRLQKCLPNGVEVVSVEVEEEPGCVAVSRNRSAD